MTPLGRANLENRWKNFSLNEGRNLLSAITPKTTPQEKEGIINSTIKALQTSVEVDYTFQTMWNFVSEKISGLTHSR